MCKGRWQPTANPAETALPEKRAQVVERVLCQPFGVLEIDFGDVRFESGACAFVYAFRFGVKYTDFVTWVNSLLEH